MVAKPDIGVGAAHTYRINDEAELTRFFEAKPPIDYIMEEFISGVIYSFDGLADRGGTRSSTPPTSFRRASWRR